MSKRVKEILGWYRNENPGVLTNLARLLNHGRLAGTGRLVILPVDQDLDEGVDLLLLEGDGALQSTAENHGDLLRMKNGI